MIVRHDRAAARLRSAWRSPGPGRVCAALLQARDVTIVPQSPTGAAFSRVRLERRSRAGVCAEFPGRQCQRDRPGGLAGRNDDRGGRGQSFCYELLYNGEGQSGEPFLLGLIDVEKLKASQAKAKYDGKRSGVNDELSAPSRPQVGPWSGGGRVTNKAQEWLCNRLSLSIAAFALDNVLLGTENKSIISYNEAAR
jgi:hypothetical protein